ncbi:hypothetical protein HNY73_006725 [Argiope bruennichi]|uniref:Prominin-like protein n=1 Tax=Argiope bruennichi TaxID=94029 RepID=A0A8T0FC43_ARGBR|nr:hypothetical protein HNY73_006725 [Argiope bruennichi]
MCVACFQQSASVDVAKEHRDAINQFNELVKWPLSPIGKFAADIVELVMSNSTRVLNETLKKGEISQLAFVTNAMFQTLAHQLGLALCVGIGVLICLFLLFLPCSLHLYRSRQRIALVNSVAEKRIDSKSKGLCLFEIFIICIAVAMLGAVIVIIASIRSYFTLMVPFGFANFTVQAAFQLKLKLLVNHQSRLNDVSRSAFDVIMLLNNVNEDVSGDFVKRLQDMLQPIMNIASSISWELTKVIELLETEGTVFNKFINDTLNHTNTYVDRFISLVRKLKKEVGETTELDPFMNITKLDISTNYSRMFTKPVPTLRKVSKIRIRAGLEEISTDLKYIVIRMQFDPSDLSEKLKHVAFKVQKNLDESTSKYIAFINAYVKEKDQGPLLEQIGRAQKESFAVAYIFNLVIFVIAVASLVLAIALVLVYHGGVCGTSCFQIVREKNRKFFLRNDTSHCCGGAVLFFSYLISVFLWICWLSCVFLFFLTSLPLTCCRAMNDYTILDMTFDSLKLRTTPGWYSLLTSEAFNMTLKQTVTRCHSDKSFVPTLPDPLVDTSDGIRIKKQLNFTSLVANFSEETRKLSPGNYTGFDVNKFKLEKLLDDIDISPPFEELKSFLTNITEKNITEILVKIKRSADDQNVAKLADTVQRVYDSMVSNVSTSLANNATFLSKIRGADLTLKVIVKHMSSLNWTADVLYSSIINGSVGLFDTALNATLNKLIDSIFLEMQLAALDYRKSMSLCSAIIIFYEKASAILCNVLLYPVASCWFGFFLLAVFLLIAVILSVKSARFFRFLPDVFQEERVVGGVRAEDLPTKSSSSISSDLKEYKDEEDVDEEKLKSDDGESKDSAAAEEKESAKSSEKQKSPEKPD